MKSDSDEVFWLRLEEMPDIEAEQELISRRQIVIRENTELRQVMQLRDRRYAECTDRFMGNQEQLTLLSDKLKEIRKRRERCSWYKAVMAIYGQEGYEKCRAWMIQEELG